MLLVLSIITTIILLFSIIEAVVGLRAIDSLDDVALLNEKLPKISIIVTACNEEDSIYETLLRLINQEYKHFEIICVNDRSIDNTGNIIDSFCDRSSLVKAIHIKHLPERWIGKSHAAYCGAQVANGDWLLFNADVHLTSSALNRAISYAIDKKLDHLTAFPYYHCQGFLHNIIHLVHKSHGYVMPLKPWLAKSKSSKRSINSGVFCLIRKTAYEAFGGHREISLAFIDDLALGEKIKQAGFSQEMVNAQNYISINWYPSWQDMFRGLKKNSFAYFNYRLLPLIFSSLAWFVLFIWPTLGIFFTSGISKYINVFNAALLFLFNWRIANFFQIAKRHVLFYPIGLIMFLYPMYLSVFHFIWHGGIYWRGTFYDAKTLRSTEHCCKKK